MEWTDTALVLQVRQIREADLWLRLLSRQRGVYHAFAFGGSRSRRRFCGCLDMLNTLRCRVSTSRDGRFLSLQEAVLQRGPRRLRVDTARFGIAVNCVRFLETLGVGEEGAAAAFALLETALSLLEENDDPPPLFPLFFRLSLASCQGFAPLLDRCGRCGDATPDGAVFLVREGALRCPHCGTASERQAVNIPRKVLDVLRLVQQKFPAVRHVGSLDLAERRCCARVIDEFVQHHLGIRWEEGRFRRI